MPFPAHATDETHDAVSDWLLKQERLEPWQQHVIDVHPAFRNHRALPPEHLARSRTAHLRARRRTLRQRLVGFVVGVVVEVRSWTR